jgi:Chromo (CHRromatin Organisation MOdifier) domain
VGHHLTTVDVHHNNGVVENLVQAWRRMMRCVMAEMGLKPEEFRMARHVVKHALNHTKSARLHGHAPITVMFGLSPSSVPQVIRVGAELKSVSTEELDAELAEWVPKAQEWMMDIHREVKESRDKRTAYNAAARTKKVEHLERQKRMSEKIDVGDYVLVARPEQHAKKDKLLLRWLGPQRVVKAISNYVFEVEDIVTGDRKEVHYERLLFYDDALLDVTVELKSFVAANSYGYEVESIVDIKKEDGQFFALVDWKGFSEHDRTWQELSQLYEEVPNVVKKYLKGNKSALALKASKSLGI